MRPAALALKLEGSPLMALTWSDGDKFLDATAFVFSHPAPKTRNCAMNLGGSATYNARPLAPARGARLCGGRPYFRRNVRVA